MGNSFGKCFVLTTFGESHGEAVGAVVDGCPPGVRISPEMLQCQLDRRRPGQSKLTTQRREADEVRLLSGVYDGVTTGAPIALMVMNTDQRPGDYGTFASVPRPSHADFTYRIKYGMPIQSGGGRASARETVGRVAGGALAEAFLAQRYGVEIVAWVSRVGTVEAPDMVGNGIGRDEVDRTPVRCPDSGAAAEMTRVIESARADGDSVGGIVTCVCRGVPAGWGEPVFDKVGALLGHAMLSLPACKGFDIGSGFAGAGKRGSANNDVFEKRANGAIGAASNRAGGVLGGITSGEPIWFRVAFKPTATIARKQQTVDYDGNAVDFGAVGRHDPCVLPRAVPVVEAMAGLVLADLALQAEAHAVKGV
jgi:chorismate synthase